MRTYRIGVPGDDAALIVRGPTAPVEHEGETCRWLSSVTRLALPVPERTSNRVTLSAAATCEQELVFSVAGRELGRAALGSGGAWTELAFDLPASLDAHPVLEIRCTRPHPLDAFAPRYAMLRALSVEKALDVPTPACAGNAEGLPEYRHYFGDIHVHTALSPCARRAGGSIEDNCRYAIEETKSDFIAFADHDSRMTEAAWRETMRELDAFERPGSFATLVGYEWTSFLYGQINVYSPSKDLPLFACTDERSETPPRLWAALREWNGPAFTAFHHPTRPGMPVSWEFCDAELMPVAEIYSGWGNSERHGAPKQKPGRCVPGTTVSDALGRGYRLGFVGGGDTHNGRPAMRGVTGVLATELSREAVFEAIRARRCYATTSEHIELDFRVNGYPMGSIVPFTPYTADLMYPLRVEYRVKGTLPLGLIEVVTDGGAVVHRRTVEEMGFSEEYSAAFEVPHMARGLPRGSTLSTNRRYLYLRAAQPKSSGDRAVALSEMVQAEMAWSSPVFLAVDYGAML